MAYYTPSLAALFSRITSTLFNSNLQLIQAAFNLIPTEWQLKLGTAIYGVDSGTADAYVITPAYTPASYTDGMAICFKALNTNTGASTINVGSLGTIALARNDGTPTVAGDVLAGKFVTARYNATSGQAEIQSTLAGIVASTRFPNVTGVVTANQTELNALTGSAITNADLVKVHAVTSSSAELNILTGATASTAEINRLVGVLEPLTRFAPPGLGPLPYSGSTAPSGWLLCSGQAVSRATYSALFAVIGTTYGVGDGVATFNVPDMRGRAPVGLDNMGGSSANRITATWADSLAGNGGEETHALSIAELASHQHQTVENASGSFTAMSGANNNNSPAFQGQSGATALNTGATGSGTAHNNLQPSIAVNYIIKT